MNTINDKYLLSQGYIKHRMCGDEFYFDDYIKEYKAGVKINVTIQYKDHNPFKTVIDMAIGNNWVNLNISTPTELETLCKAFTPKHHTTVLVGDLASPKKCKSHKFPPLAKGTTVVPSSFF